MALQCAHMSFFCSTEPDASHFVTEVKGVSKPVSLVQDLCRLPRHRIFVLFPFHVFLKVVMLALVLVAMA